jgi:hypothetical protein
MRKEMFDSRIIPILWFDYIFCSFVNWVQWDICIGISFNQMKYHIFFEFIKWLPSINFSELFQHFIKNVPKNIVLESYSILLWVIEDRLISSEFCFVFHFMEFFSFQFDRIASKNRIMHGITLYCMTIHSNTICCNTFKHNTWYHFSLHHNPSEYSE